MGIINITPDSFSDGGKYFEGKINYDKILEDALRMEKEGADFIDIGGESTRPGSEMTTMEDELERVIPAIEIIRKKTDIPISIDTYKSEVADEALNHGAAIVNDISGFKFDKKMPEVTTRHNASCILMHIKGTPKDMQMNPEYENVVKEVYEYLSDSISIAKSAGIEQIITDVGIGFGKKLEHNLELIKNLSEFKKLGYPILLGVSNKRFIDNISPVPVNERLEGTIAANVAGIINGANIIRVHDVLENKKAALVADKMKQ
ncbi:MAG: dihydropteroate synthase [Ignavibacteriae bacterium]|nr:dihydropteroate synthase [Ignavibacteriota bacterium]